MANNQVALSNLPIDTSGQWTQVNIYRNTNSTPGDTNFYEIANVPMATAHREPNYTYTDNATDSSIASNKVLNFNGPPVTSATLAQNVVEYNARPEPTRTFSLPATNGPIQLQFHGNQGRQHADHADFTVTDTSTLKDLASFLQGSLGIQSPPGNDPNNPIPVDSRHRPGTGRDHHLRRPDPDRGQ